MTNSSPRANQPTSLTVDLGESLWDTIAAIRDAAPRATNDADTDEIVAALFPVLGRFLRHAARGHMADARAAEDANGDEPTPAARARLAAKAQALTDLADQIDEEHTAESKAI